jgi:hypothetical protein
MTKVNRIVILLVASLFSGHSYSQSNGYFHEGEFGVTVGAAHYFGDLNTKLGLNNPKPAVGIFFRKQFGNYIGVRAAARFAQLGYSDTYSKNAYQRTRNLSFNSNVYEFALQGDFNFMKYIPGDPLYFFTPYITLGVGIFSYDPYTYYRGTKVFLRPLGTEGQNGGYMGRKPYGTTAFSIPFGVGIKYSINQKMNLSFEVTQHFTTTDYLDDVSTTYAPKDPYFTDGPNGYSIAYLLQDRSYEIDPNNPLSSVPGRQRGWSKQKDQFIVAEIGLSFNISSYRCPTQ